jgi:hypothetical protein
MIIFLVAINGYSIGDYFIGGYFIINYCWIF